LFVTYGPVGAVYSIATGNGVDPAYLNNTVGTNTTFQIELYNQYGVRLENIVSCPNKTMWDFSFTPPLSTFMSQVVSDTLVCNPQTAIYTGYYNATTATTTENPFNIIISYNQTVIGHNTTYHSVVNPGPVDANHTRVLGMDDSHNDTGVFYLEARDRFNNTIPNVSSKTFQVGLQPSCSQTTVTTSEGTGQWETMIQCNYEVALGGTYCVVISYQSEQLPLANSTLTVYGGTACAAANHCSNQGVCFVAPGETDASCNCFQNYMGNDCSIDTSEYPLKTGAIVGMVVGFAVFFLLVGLLVGFLIPKLLNRSGSSSQPLLL